MSDRWLRQGVAESMTLLGRLALLFVVVPLAELALLVEVGGRIGVWPTVGLVFLTGVVGAALARAEGLRTFWALRRDLSRGRLPGQAILDGLSILVGGALLLTPGFITDVAGFALLLPPSRRLLQRLVRRRLRGMIEDGRIRIVTSSTGPFGAGGDKSADTGGEPERDPDKEILA